MICAKMNSPILTQTFVAWVGEVNKRARVGGCF